MGEPLEKTMRMRTYVLNEILKAEEDYVETLKFIVNVFMERLKSREDDENDKLVSPGSVKTLLANIEDLYKFHQEMLANIRETLAPEPNYSHEIGKVFLKHKEQFKIYQPYCSNHERAQKKLNELTENQEFQGFILGCLMLGNYVNDVSMEGFLLTPIQRICKYPMLLRELLKKTPPDHPDHSDVKEACDVMKEVCSAVNETKRQLEQLEYLEEIQASIANWEGVNLTDVSTRLIKQGSLLKISVGNFQERHFFLFDHLLVYVKKINNLPRLQSAADLKTGTIRRGRNTKSKSSRDLHKKWLFKGRISTELMEIENLEDGASDYHCGGSSVTNAWKVLNAAKNKWFVLIAKDKEEKETWLNEFVLEREKRKSKANLDQRDGIDVTHARGKKLYFRLTHQKIIRDRKYKMRSHSKSFPGNELVNWLVENKECRSNEEAVLFGQALIDCGLIHHVNDKHHFRNDSTLYRFRYDDGTFKSRVEKKDRVAKGLRVYFRLHCLFQPVIRDKDKNWKSYKSVVEGKKLVDWLVDQGDCQNRDEASNFGQTLCENGILHHASDKQDFKDDASLFRFFPDEDTMDTGKLREHLRKSSKSDFRLLEEIQTKTLLLLNTSENEDLGVELSYCEESYRVFVSAVKNNSQAQMQGFATGMEVVQINSIVVTCCPSEEALNVVMKYNKEKYRMIHFVVKMSDEDMVSIPVTEIGMGFQIKGSNPCIVHCVSKGGVAMNSGLLRGHAIFKINGQLVTDSTHDEVAQLIRDGCSLQKADQEKAREIQTRSESPSPTKEEEGKTESSSTLSTPSAVRRVKSFRKTVAKMSKEKKISNVVSPTKRTGVHLDLLVGNRHLERTCIYSFTNVNGVRNNVIEKMSETPSLFDLAAQLLEVLAVEDAQVLEDVQSLDAITSEVVDVKLEVFERRRSLRVNVIQKRLDNYKKYKRHLMSYMWPSYKIMRNRPSRLTAKDFCPTNCHVNLMTVSHPTERYHLKGFGHSESKGDNEMFDVENLINTTHSVTCVAAPSHRTKGKQRHGLSAVLRGAEGNVELMDSVRSVMASLDSALLELKQGQKLLINILHSEREEKDKRSSMQSVTQRDSYQDNGDSIFTIRVPQSPVSQLRESKKDSNNAPTKTLSNERISLLKESSIPEETDDCDNEDSSPKEIITSIKPEHKDRNKLSLNVSAHSPTSPSDSSGSRPGSIEGGHESECDSGIHSNRGSLADHEKLTFTFSNTNQSENNSDSPGDGDDKTNRTSGISTTNSSDRMSESGDHRTIKGAMSLPSLATPLPVGNSSPSNALSTKNRPNSGRHRVSYLSAAGSTCSSEGVESLNFTDLDLSPDGLDKLHGTMEHFMSKIQNLDQLIKSATVKNVFEITEETTPQRDYNKIIEGFAFSTGVDAIRMSLAVCNDVDQVVSVISTLMESVENHMNEIRTQLVVAVLLNEDPELVARRDKVFSQSLITAISSFSAQLRSALAGTFNNMKAYGVSAEEASRKWLEQCMSIGACVVFQTTLDLKEADECTMLEDSLVGIYDLDRVSFHFKAITGKVEPNECPYNVNGGFDGAATVSVDGNGVGYSMEGNRCALKVYFHLEKHVFIKLPPRLQAGGGVKLIPVLINHGLVDLGNMLYKQEVTMQEFSSSINERAYDRMYDYYKKFRAFYLDRSKLPRDNEARAVYVDKLSRPLNALDEVVSLLESNVRPLHEKGNLSILGCGVLPLAGEYCHRVGACSVIACYSGTHRSTASCCLQQARALTTCHSLPPKHALTAAFQMCRLGARQYAQSKNPGAVNRPNQSIPRLYRLFYDEPEAVSLS